MGTHDEETRKYFANSRVNCILFPREATHLGDSLVGRNTTDRIFTHHQKTVRVAAPSRVPSEPSAVALVHWCGVLGNVEWLVQTDI